ncbi:MAG: chemoreceptor glutamine deamidase CheD [Pseudomonadota bacterium]
MQSVTQAEFSPGRVVNISAGECYITGSPDETISTVLGSCVSACIRDKKTGIGGMNHFLLPHAEGSTHNDRVMEMRYGIHAMEHLLRQIHKRTGPHVELEVKLFGGGSVLPILSDVGAHNVDFVRRYVRQKGLAVAGEDLGGNYSRKLHYHPASGKARLKKLRSVYAESVAADEKRYLNQIGSKLN